MDLQLAAISDVPDIVGTIAQDPLSVVLLLLGALFVAVSLGFFGLLTLGAVVEFIIPDSVAARHP